MSFSLLNISSMYPGYLQSFYKSHPDIHEMSYKDHYNLLISETTEFAGSYNRNFRKLGVNSECIVGNDGILQDKWKKENGHGKITNNELLDKQIEKWKPDILWLENINSLSREWIDSVKQRFKYIRLTGAYHCSPFNPVILDKLKGVDFVVTCTPGLKQSFEKEGIKSYLVYHGFDSDLLLRLKKPSGPPEKNIVFSGSLFTGGELHNARINLIEQILEENLGMELYVNLEKSYKIRIKQGLYSFSRLLKSLNMSKILSKIPVMGYSGEPVKNYSEALKRSNMGPRFGIDMYDLFSQSKIVLNIHLGMAGSYAGNMRLFEVTGTGSCLLTDNKKNIGDLFSIGNEIIVYDNADDCVEKIKWLSEHEAERKAIAQSGHIRTLKDHTVEQRCRQIIDIIESQLKRL